VCKYKLIEYNNCISPRGIVKDIINDKVIPGLSWMLLGKFNIEFTYLNNDTSKVKTLTIHTLTFDHTLDELLKG
jgi:hypothetical protein